MWILILLNFQVIPSFFALMQKTKQKRSR